MAKINVTKNNKSWQGLKKRIMAFSTIGGFLTLNLPVCVGLLWGNCKIKQCRNCLWYGQARNLKVGVIRRSQFVWMGNSNNEEEGMSLKKEEREVRDLINSKHVWKWHIEICNFISFTYPYICTYIHGCIFTYMKVHSHKIILLQLPLIKQGIKAILEIKSCLVKYLVFGVGHFSWVVQRHPGGLTNYGVYGSVLGYPLEHRDKIILLNI